MVYTIYQTHQLSVHQFSTQRMCRSMCNYGDSCGFGISENNNTCMYQVHDEHSQQVHYGMNNNIEEYKAIQELCLRLSQGTGPSDERELGDWWHILVGRRLTAAVTNSCSNSNILRTGIRNLPQASESVSCFFSVRRVPVSPAAYAERVRRYSRCSDGVYLHALVLLRRIADKDSRLALSPANVHRMLLTAVVISAKFDEHAWFTNAWYARVGGISSVSELNRLEVEMLRILDYRVLASPCELLTIADLHPFNSLKAA